MWRSDLRRVQEHRRDEPPRLRPAQGRREREVFRSRRRQTQLRDEDGGADADDRVGDDRSAVGRPGRRRWCGPSAPSARPRGRSRRTGCRRPPDAGTRGRPVARSAGTGRRPRGPGGAGHTDGPGRLLTSPRPTGGCPRDAGSAVGQGGSVLDRDGVDDDCPHAACRWRRSDGADLVDDLARRAVGDLAEDRVLALEPGRRAPW